MDRKRARLARFLEEPPFATTGNEGARYADSCNKQRSDSGCNRMGMIMRVYAPRDSGIVVGTWEMFEGIEEDEVATGSTVHDRFASSPYPDD